jgi:hypothetical protein
VLQQPAQVLPQPPEWQQMVLLVLVLVLLLLLLSPHRLGHLRELLSCCCA